MEDWGLVALKVTEEDCWGMESSTLVPLGQVHWMWRRALAKKTHILHRAALSLFYRVQVKKVFFLVKLFLFFFVFTCKRFQLVKYLQMKTCPKEDNDDKERAVCL